MRLVYTLLTTTKVRCYDVLYRISIQHSLSSVISDFESVSELISYILQTLTAACHLKEYSSGMRTPIFENVRVYRVTRYLES